MATLHQHGLPFDPGAATQYRLRKALGQAREMDQISRDQKRDELRALGRRLDDEAKQRRRQRKRDEEAAWKARWDS